MAGGMFASHFESGGDLIEIEGKLYKQFYGMSSAVAMTKVMNLFIYLLYTRWPPVFYHLLVHRNFTCLVHVVVNT